VVPRFFDFEAFLCYYINTKLKSVFVETNINPSNNSKTKYAILAVLVVAVIIGVLALVNQPKKKTNTQNPSTVQKQPEPKFTAPPLSKDYVLSSDAKVTVQPNSKNPANPIQVTNFTTTKTTAELIKFYTAKLKADGYTIVDQRNVGNTFQIVASYEKNNLNVNIFITPTSSGTNQVSLVYRYLR
jgi:hypothetical protein